MEGFSNSTDDFTLDPSRSILTAVNTIIACLAVFGNGVVIAVMLLRRRQFSSFTNRLILHQSIIDLLAGVVFFFLRVVINVSVLLSTEGEFSQQFICRFLYSEFLLWWATVTSTYNLVVISLERFMATCHPVRHRNMWSSATKLKFAIAISWTVGFIYSLEFMFVIEPREGQCKIIPMSPAGKVFQMSLIVVIECLVPLSILIYTYTRIFIKLAEKTADPKNGPRNAANKAKRNKAKRNVLVTALLITIACVGFTTPVLVLSVFREVAKDLNNWLYGPLVSVYACSMFVNPIIYCFKYEHFRSHLRQLIHKRFRRGRVGDGGDIPI